MYYINKIWKTIFRPFDVKKKSVIRIKSENLHPCVGTLAKGKTI